LSMAFVYRSFYGMRIQTGESPARARVQARA